MRKILMAACLAAPFMALSMSASAADAVGRWKTIDSDTGKEKSIVEISKNSNGIYSGRIVELLNPSKPNPICDKCKDDRKNKPITGMEIIRAGGNAFDAAVAVSST